MNEEQRALAQEHMFIVGLRVKRRMMYIPQGEWADYYQIGCVGLCKAAMTYRPGEYTFNTYASRCIDNEIFMALRREKVRREERRAMSLDAMDGTQTLGARIEDVESVETRYGERELRRRIAGMTQTERRIIAMRAQGVGQTEIGRAVSLSQSYVSRTIRRMEKMLRESKSA